MPKTASDTPSQRPERVNQGVHLARLDRLNGYADDRMSRTNGIPCMSRMIAHPWPTSFI